MHIPTDSTKDEVKVLPEVLREIAAAAALIPLIGSDLGAGWCSEAYMFDASSSGVGVMSRKLPQELVREVAQHNNHRHFSR